MLKLYISVLGINILPLEWPCKQGSEIVKACILFGEKRCSGSTSKVCYWIEGIEISEKLFEK